MHKMVNGVKVPLTKEEIEEFKTREKQHASFLKSKEYKKSRRVYPSIQEQLDMLYWDMKNGTNKWLQLIDKIKNGD